MMLAEEDLNIAIEDSELKDVSSFEDIEALVKRKSS